MGDLVAVISWLAAIVDERAGESACIDNEARRYVRAVGAADLGSKLLNNYTMSAIFK